jgi:uncharacterized protein YciI
MLTENKMNKLLLCLLLFSTEAVAQPYVFVFLNKKTDKAVLAKEEEDKLMEGHMNNMKRLGQEGKLQIAGPFEGGGGIFVFNSGSVAEVSSWVESDPAVKAKRWNLEIFPFEVVHGSLCKAAEPFEMTMYSFVRFDPTVGLMEDLQSHVMFMKNFRSDVLIAGKLGSDGLSLMIVKGKLEDSEVVVDPLVKSKALTPTYKSLYIAKGSFCEK